MAEAKAPPRVLCPNCGDRRAFPRDACMLEAMLRVLLDRGNVTEAQVIEYWASADSDAFWNDIGKIVDSIEDELTSGGEDEGDEEEEDEFKHVDEDTQAYNREKSERRRQGHQ